MFIYEREKERDNAGEEHSFSLLVYSSNVYRALLNLEILNVLWVSQKGGTGWQKRPESFSVPYQNVLEERWIRS